MADVSKIVPKYLDPNKEYIVRVRSINPLGKPSTWSEGLYIDTSRITTAAGLFTQSNSEFSILNDDGELVFGAFSTKRQRTNLVSNPSFETNAIGWSALSDSVISRLSAQSFYGNSSAAIIPQTPVTGLANIGITLAPSDYIPVSVNQFYTISLYVYREYIPAAHGSTNNEHSFVELSANLYDASNSLKSRVKASQSIRISNNEWTRVHVENVVIPTGVSKLGLTFKLDDKISQPLVAESERVFIDAVLIEQSSKLDSYFDGSTVGGSTSWSGAPHASSSIFNNASSSTVFIKGALNVGGILESTNYLYSSGVYSDAGTQIDLSTGTLKSPNFSIDASGDVYISGYLQVGSAAADINNNVTTISGDRITTGTLEGDRLSATTSIQIGDDAGGSQNYIIIEGGATPSQTFVRSADSGFGTGNGFYMDATGRFSLGSALTYENGILSIGGGTGGLDYVPIGGAAADINSGVTKISGGQIETGTLNAAVITTGTLTADKIVIGGLDSQDIFGSNVIGIEQLTFPIYTQPEIDYLLGNLQINLGSGTIGSFVSTVVGTPNQVIITGAGIESATPTFSLPQDIHEAATPTFSRLFLSQSGSTVPPMTVQSTATVLNLNADLLDGQHGAYYRSWNNATDKPDPVVSVALTGAVSGSNSHVWTDLSGNINLSIATTLNMGPGSMLNADLLDGFDSSHFLNASNLNDGTVPAARLSGSYTFNLTGALTGNASTATALQTTRTIAGKDFNGTQNVTLSALTAGTYITAGGTYNGSTARTFAVDATPSNTASKVVARDADGGFSAGVLNLTRASLTQATGVAPLTVASTTRVDNLNADLLDGQHSDFFASSDELESLLGDLLYVGLYAADAYDADLGGPKPTPVWGGGPTVYRHAMYWVVASAGTLDFIDDDLSGRFDIDDGTVSVSNGDWIIAIDPLVGTTGHELGTDLGAADVVFQYIPFSAEDYISSQIALHSSEEDPHSVAGYLKRSLTDILYAPQSHEHNADIEQYVVQHGQRITHPVLAMGIEDEQLTLEIAPGSSILLGSTVSLSFPPGPFAYLTGMYEVTSKPSADTISVTVAGAADLAFAVAPEGVTTTTEPHPYYLRKETAATLYAPALHNHAEDISAAIEAHRPGDPHVQYLTTSRGDNRYDLLGSTAQHATSTLAHRDLYYTKEEADGLFEFSQALANHVADADPHPGYLQQSEADGLYSGLLHQHHDLYYTKSQTVALVAAAAPAEVIATDGASSARVFLGNEIPADPRPGDLWIKTANVEIQAPVVPSGLSAIALSESSVRVSWNAWPSTADLTGISVQISTTGNPASYVAASPPANLSDIEYTFTGLSEDTRYWFRVSAQNPATVSLLESQMNWGYINLFTQNLTPPAPTGAVVSVITSTSMRLSWTPPSWPDPGDPDARYEVAIFGTTVLDFALGTNTFFDFTGLTEVTAYQPKVRAVDRGGLRSAWLTTSATTLNAAPPAPGAFTGTPTADTGSPRVTATWAAYSPAIPDFLHYEVQLRRDSDNAVLATVTTTNLSWTTPETTFGTAVHVRVRTVDTGALTSAWVQSATVSTRADELIAPTITGGTPDDTITATWTAPVGLANFSGYELHLFEGDTPLASVDLDAAATTFTWTNRTFGATLRTRLRVKRASGTAPATGSYSATATMVANPIPSFAQVASENSVTTTVIAPSVLPTNFLRYVVELWVSGGAAAVATQYPTTAGDVSFTGLAYATTYTVRGRIERTGTAQSGSFSAWQATVTTGPHPDTTPPVLPTITSWQPEGVYGRMWLRLTWPGGADHAAIHVQRSVNGGTWTDITFNTTTLATAFNLGDWAAGTSIQARARSRDAIGNWSAWRTSSTYTLAESPSLVFCDATNYWRDTNGGEYNADGLSRPIQGYYTNGFWNARGMLYYGQNIRNACAGKTVTSIKVTLDRFDGGGTAGAQNIHVVNHDIATNPGRVTGVARPEVYNEAVIASLAWNQSTEATLTTAQRDAFITGTARGLGIFISSGNQYVILKSRANSVFQGLVRVFHYG
jgi:hypothetical protein